MTSSDHDRLFGAHLARFAHTAPDRIALVFGQHRWTYAELDRVVGDFAATLRHEGVRRGDRVVMAGLARPEALITMFAVARLGAVLVPVHATSTVAELDVILAATGSGATAGDARFLARATSAGVLLCWDDDIPGTRPLRAKDGLDPVRHWDCSAGDDVIIAYTSGTSGKPKGAVLTHENLHWSTRNALPRLDIRADDTVLIATPLAHVAVLAGLPQYAWAVGATVVLAYRFDADRFADEVRDNGVTIAFAVSAMLSLLVRSARWPTIQGSTLRWVLAGGGPPLSSATLAMAEAGITVINSYGLTETSAGVSYADPHEVVGFPTSAGTPVDHAEIRVVTPTGRVTEPGDDGEIWVRGPSTAHDYVLTDGTRSPALDADGWLHSGDRGLIDPDGRLFVTGRLKDTIVTGGENVDPIEVENAILAIDGVQDVAVVGIPDETWGQVVMAMAVMQPGLTTTLDVLRETLGPTLSPYKLPRRLLLTESLPRTPTGKLKRAELIHRGSSTA